MTHHSSLPLSGGAPESHPIETSAEALVASFAEADQHSVDLSGYSIEDWICLGFFWTMAGLVFLQFFSRYVLNDSFAWTEELAVYCLMPGCWNGKAHHRSNQCRSASFPVGNRNPRSQSQGVTSPFLGSTASPGHMLY